MCLASYSECPSSNLGTETAAFSPGISQSLQANCWILPWIRLMRLYLKYFQIYYSTIVINFESLWGYTRNKFKSTQNSHHFSNKYYIYNNPVYVNIYRVIKNDCRGFNNLSYTIHLEIGVYVFFYLIEQHSKFLLHTLEVLYMCTLCDSTNINTIIEFVPHKTPSHCRSLPS